MGKEKRTYTMDRSIEAFIMETLEDKRLGEEVIRRFKEAQKQLVVGGEKRSRTVHASHITGACMRKSWYEFREKPEPLSAESIANFYVGQLLHRETPLARKNEIKYSANIRTMKPIDVKDINDYNLFDCVTGTADDLIEWEGDLVIADKKTWSSLKINYRNGGTYEKKELTEPDESYVNQLNIYKLLNYICDGVQAKKGVLLYLDKATSFKEPLPFVFDLKPVDEIRSWVIDRLDKIKQLVEPDRVITKYCRYCPFKTICNPPKELIPPWS